MALQTSGSISLADMATEFGDSAPYSMSEYATWVGKTAAGGQNVSFNDFYGKYKFVTINLTISSNTTNYNLKTALINAGWDGVTPINCTCTINSGVYVYSTSTGSYAFQTGTSFPINSKLYLINNGTIQGMGGTAGAGGAGAAGGTGAAGGPAFYAGTAITVTNNGRIAGGGGGAGGGGAGY